LKHASGELLKDGKKVYDVKLRLAAKEMMVDEVEGSARRAAARLDLITNVVRDPVTPLWSIPDGGYKLRYFFDGKTEEREVRIRGWDDAGW
jgi:hypothetical protein